MPPVSWWSYCSRRVARRLDKRSASVYVDVAAFRRSFLEVDMEKPVLSYSRFVSMIRFLAHQKNPDRDLIARLKVEATASRLVRDSEIAERDVKAYADWAKSK